MVATILISAPSFAQNKTRIGAAHPVSFGTGFGYASSPVAAFGGAFVDINASGSNLRTRVGFNIENIKQSFCGSAEVDIQYLLPLYDVFYFYPFAGVKAAYHDYELFGDKASGFAPQAGLGMEVQFSSNIGIFVQGTYEYEVSGLGSLIFGQAGLTFAFGQGRDGARKAAPAPKTATVKTISTAEAQARAAAKAAAVEASIAKTKEEAAARAAAANTPKSARVASSGKVVSPDSTYKVNFMANTTFVNQEGRAAIDLLIAYLKTHPDKTIEVVCYADSGSADEDGDIGLAQKRIAVLKSFFTIEGIDASRINARVAMVGENPLPSPEGNPEALISIK